LLRLQRDRSAKAARLRRLDELQARADQSDPLAMTVLGRYRLVERLGSGGMASVYRGLPEDTLDANQAVAVKVMQKDLAQEEEFRRRFHREIKVVKGLHHPNIVSLIDWGEQDGLLYLVMELVRGQPLTSRIPETGLPLGQAMQYLRPLFAALLYAHSQNVIHRDLKPDNVMVDEQGRVKVMDFGLAKSHDVSRITRTGSAMGTPAYMPPEQFTGGSPDQRSDQYSLGVVIYEMLTGRRPFEEEDTMVMLFKHMSEPPPPLRSLRPDLPEAVEPVVLRMLNKDPEERYPDLAAALQALEEASQGASSAGTAPGAPTREGGEATFIG
ncbi:MAG TPA: serine/threonine-protein kinase, partial [Candidatus Nitrosotenuis sp.]|nr:serine/threonine-protein kinase [Candidatus Nitrosotenuis sp.]